MPPYQAAVYRNAIRVGALAMLAAAGCGSANAESLSRRDVQIVAKAIGFLQPPPTGPATVAIAYDPANPVSKQDADTIAGYFGDGLKAGAAVLKPRVTEAGKLAAGGFIAVIAASGVEPDRVAAAAQAQHAACITADATAVQAGRCTMAVRSKPRVEILISRAAAAGSGVTFGSAFLLMARAI